MTSTAQLFGGPTKDFKPGVGVGEKVCLLRSLYLAPQHCNFRIQLVDYRTGGYLQTEGPGIVAKLVKPPRALLAFPECPPGCSLAHSAPC